MGAGMGGARRACWTFARRWFTGRNLNAEKRDEGCCGLTGKAGDEHMAGTAAARARIRTEEAAGAAAADQALAGLGAAMRVAESTDHAVDGAAAAVAATAATGVEAAVERERVAYRGSTSVCPRCYSPNMAPSRRQTVAVRVLRAVGVELQRCRSCGKRSWWF